MRSFRVASASLCLLAVAALASACGSSGTTDSTSATAGNRPAPSASEFPKAEGKSLGEVLNSAAGPSKLVVSPASQVFYKGENRYSFGVFEADRTQVPDAKVALYFAKVPSAKGGASTTGSNSNSRTKAAPREPF